MGDVPPDDPGVAPPFHDLEVDEDGVATPSGIDTSTEAVLALVESLRAPCTHIGAQGPLDCESLRCRCYWAVVALAAERDAIAQRRTDPNQVIERLDAAMAAHPEVADVLRAARDEVEHAWLSSDAAVFDATKWMHSTGAQVVQWQQESVTLLAERDRLAAVLAAVPEDQRRCAEAVVDIEASGVLPWRGRATLERATPTIDFHAGQLFRCYIERLKNGCWYWSARPDDQGAVRVDGAARTAVEAARAALAAAGVEAPAADTDGGA